MFNLFYKTPSLLRVTTSKQDVAIIHLGQEKRIIPKKSIAHIKK